MQKLLFILVYLSLWSCGSSRNEPATEVQKEIGRHLFYEKRLSLNQSKSCGSCHNPEFAFTDGYKRSFGAFADMHRHNTLPLFNLNYLSTYSLVDSNIVTLERQMLEPFFGTHPVEMGMDSSNTMLLESILSDKPYQELFQKLPVSKQHKDWPFVIESIAMFIKSIESKTSRYDEYLSGEKEIFDKEEQKGMQLFFSKEVGCTNCHGGFNFSEPKTKSAYMFYSSETRYRIPTLRNLTFTAPYLHDGSAASLTEVLKSYQNIDFVKNLYHRNLPGVLLPSRQLNDEDVYNLVKFLKTLDDPAIKTNSDYRNPFSESF